ncbi:NUDIX domain-containing protein [Candidatus Dojkabacteria bacterium]|nr:NUDIX domain-containing protein [Candidatus Dojkabacteria bacterium]
MGRIQIVDSNDKVIGPMSREDATSQKKIRRIVRVLLMNSNGQFLLQKRSATKNIFPSAYDQTVGGHVDEGEDYIDAAVRETKEEIGLNIREQDLDVIAHFYSEEVWNDVFIRMFNKLFLLKSEALDLNSDKTEVENLVWFSRDEIDEMFNNAIEKLSGGFRIAWIEYKKFTGEVKL